MKKITIMAIAISALCAMTLGAHAQGKKNSATEFGLRLKTPKTATAGATGGLDQLIAEMVMTKSPHKGVAAIEKNVELYKALDTASLGSINISGKALEKFLREGKKHKFLFVKTGPQKRGRKMIYVLHSAAESKNVDGIVAQEIQKESRRTDSIRTLLDSAKNNEQRAYVWAKKRVATAEDQNTDLQKRIAELETDKTKLIESLTYLETTAPKEVSPGTGKKKKRK